MDHLDPKENFSYAIELNISVAIYFESLFAIGSAREKSTPCKHIESFSFVFGRKSLVGYERVKFLICSYRCRCYLIFKASFRWHFVDSFFSDSHFCDNIWNVIAGSLEIITLSNVGWRCFYTSWRSLMQRKKCWDVVKRKESAKCLRKLAVQFPLIFLHRWKCQELRVGIKMWKGGKFIQQ